MNQAAKIPTILCIGKATQDVFLRDPEFNPHIEGRKLFAHLPLGEKLDVREAFFTTGGNATNVAVTFARQGLHSRYVWELGKHDPVSQAILRELDDESVDTRFVQERDDVRASYSTILLSEEGERTILNFHGSIPRSADLVDQFGAFDGATWVYPTSVGRMVTLERIIHEAAKRGVRVMLNPAGNELAHPERLKSLLHDVEVLCLNKEEMQQLVTGRKLESLVRHGLSYCPVVIVSDGPNGVCASDGKTIVHAGMYEDVPVLDRTGAGDAFASGFLSQWALGKPLRDCIVFASANSTSVVAKIGSKAGILHAGARLHDMEIKEEEF